MRSRGIYCLDVLATAHSELVGLQVQARLQLQCKLIVSRSVLAEYEVLASLIIRNEITRVLLMPLNILRAVLVIERVNQFLLPVYRIGPTKVSRESFLP